MPRKNKKVKRANVCNLFCPLHGTPIYNEQRTKDDKAVSSEFIEVSTGTCLHEGCPHTVRIFNKVQSADGIIEIHLY